MRIARIARLGAIFDSLVGARTFEHIKEFRDIESAFEENVNGVISVCLAKPAYAHMPGYREFQINGDFYKANLLKRKQKGR